MGDQYTAGSDSFVGPLPQEASASGLINSLSSAIGNVADMGFKLQNQQYQAQAQSQDIQLKTLLGNLGFQTQVVQAQSAADIARINAQKSVAQAQGTGGLSLSPTLLLLIAGGVYFMAKKG
jgi:hypothetical protein